jgi:uncharacterized membrane protein
MSNQSTVAIYHTHAEAESAIKALEQSGFDMTQLSIVGQGYHTEENIIGYYNTGDRIKAWGSAGAFWGGIWGLLFGSAFFMIPGVGPLFVAGPLVSWIVGVLEGAIVLGAAGALGAGLMSIGIPKDSIIQYETALKAGKFLLIAHSTPEALEQARGILEKTAPEMLHRHD